MSATQLWDGHTTDERSMQSYGNYVDIRHADYRQQSLVTRYAHLFKFIVAKGEKVKEGQLIGYSGATGNVFWRAPALRGAAGRQAHQPSDLAG